MGGERDPWLDNVRVVAIWLVVVGHGVGLVRNHTAVAPAISNFIYLFHIPLFAMMSGWTVQRLHASGPALSRMFTQLIVPYVLFEVFASWMSSVTNNHGFRPSLELPTFGLWYLLSLATWRIWWPWVRGSDRRAVVGVAIAAAVAVGYFSRIDHVFSISRSFVFFPAFLIGALFGGDLRPWLVKRTTRVVSFAALGIAVGFAWFTRGWLDRDWLLGSRGYVAGGSEQWWAGSWRLVSIVAGILLALAAASLIPRGRTGLSRFGRYTLYAYLLHIVIRQIVSAAVLIPDQSGYRGLAAVLVAASALTFVLMSWPIRSVTWPAVEPTRLLRSRRE